LGKHTELREVGPDHHVVIWQTESGNVMLELDSFDTEVVLTSNSVVHAKKITRFDRFFGNTS